MGILTYLRSLLGGGDDKTVALQQYIQFQFNLFNTFYSYIKNSNIMRKNVMKGECMKQSLYGTFPLKKIQKKKKNIIQFLKQKNNSLKYATMTPSKVCFHLNMGSIRLHYTCYNTLVTM